MGTTSSSDAFRRGARLRVDPARRGRTICARSICEAAPPPLAESDLTPPLCLRVENSLAALQQIARFWRRKLSLRVIGITGSVGKSTTKEVVAQVLSERFRTLRSRAI